MVAVGRAGRCFPPLRKGTRKETARKRGGERASFVFLSSHHSKQFNRHRAAKCYVAAVSRRLGWIESLKNEIYVRITKPAKMYVLESDRGRHSYQGGKNLHSLTFSHEMTYRARTRSVCSVCLRETVNGSKGVAVRGAGHDMVPCPPMSPLNLAPLSRRSSHKCRYPDLWSQFSTVHSTPLVCLGRDQI